MSFRYQHGDRPLEGYTILRGIGRGGFGEVYYAVSDGGREVALKVIQQNHEIELRGIQHCINLKSPHLVSIFDVRTNAEGTPFVIMEYVAGPSLRDILRSAPEGLGTEKAAFLLREIARGLSYLHERGIVHRDLKPENIFFEDGYVKIGDYGLSKYIAVSRQSGQTISVGTVHYMAPEIGSGNYSQGIDIYSLGVVFYELLTGRVPFEGSSMGEILLKHLTAEPDLSPVPEALRPAAARALAKSPKDRFPSAREFADAVLDAGDLRRRLEGFEPASLSAHPGLAAPAEPARPSPPERVAPPPIPGKSPPPIPPKPPPPAPAADPAAEHLAAGPVPGPPTFSLAPSPSLAQRLTHGAIAAVAMSFGISLFTRGHAHDVGQHLFIIAGCAGAILFVERWLADRLGLGMGIGRRLAAFAHAVPVLLIAQAAFGTSERLVYAVLAALALTDWSARTKARRAEQASLQLAVSAAILGGVVAAVFGADPLRGAGILAALSLVTGAAAPFARSVRSEASAGPEGARPPPPPAVRPQPAATGSGRTKLARPRTDRWIAGVASGLARTYGWDVVWVRVGFLLLTVFAGVGPVVYLVLWICMPVDPVPPGEPRFLPSGFLKRLFWVAAAAAFASLSVAALGDAWDARIFGLDRETSAHLAATGSIALAAASALLATVTPVRTGLPARSPRDAAGWSALGSVLLALALLPVLVGAILSSGAGAEIFGERLPGGSWIQDFGRRGEHLAIAALFFLPGFFCVLLGRRAGGAAHVLRGAIGWTVASAVVVMLARSAPALFHPLRPGLGSPPYVADFGALAGLAALSAVCLAWPRRLERGEVKP